MTVTVGFNPRHLQTTKRESRSDDSCRRYATQESPVVAGPWIETHGYHQRSLRDQITDLPFIHTQYPAEIQNFIP